MKNINGEAGCKGRGNIAPVTINLPRIGIEAKGDIDKFFEILKSRLVLAKESLLHRYGILKKLRVKDLPFVAGQKLMKGAENLEEEDSIEPILRQGTWGIGFIGLAEELTALIGKHHGENDEARELGVKIVTFIRQYTDKFSQETSLNWSCYATPAEGLSGKFIKKDQKMFGIIKGVTDKEYYTNSYHIPVKFPISIKRKIDIEAPYHKLCNAGHISYIEVDDSPTGEQIMDIINYAYKNTNISYIGINFHIRYCKNCGSSINSNEKKCPKCNSIDIQGISRVTGYLSLDERDVIMGGMIANKTIKTTKRNDIMAFLDLEDLYGNIEVIVFPQTLKKYNQILNEDSIIFIRGVLNIKEGEEPKIVARDIVDIDNVYQLNRGIYDSKKHINNTENHRKNSKNGLYLKVDSYNNLNMMENISNILKRYPGEENIFLYAEDTKKLYKYNGFSVTISDRLITELNNILPKENIKIR